VTNERVAYASTGRRARDSQRQKLYDAENLAFYGTIEPVEWPPPDWRTVSECQKFVEEVTASPAWKRLCPFGPHDVTVTDGRGRRRGGSFTETDTIALPKFARRRWYVLHELAHLTTLSENMAWHGPEYVSAYLHLASEFLSSEEHAALVSAMAERRVKTCDYMGSGVYDGTTVRHVTVADTTPIAREAEPVTDTDTRCLGCGMVLATSAGKRRFCSDRCRHTYHNRLRHERGEGDRQKVCEVCGTAFIASRADAKTCSAACRQRLRRQRR
jgi:putative metallohydrolase (TIGR04338 family)